MQTWLAEQTPFLVFAMVCAVAFSIQYWWLRKVKFARLPWRVWILAALLLGVGWRISEQAGQRELNRIQKLTEDFARLYGDEMEKRGHWKLPSNVAGDDPLYLNLIETEKTWEKLNPDVSDIYTLRKLPSGKNIFIVDSETDYNHNGKYDEEREQRTPVGEVYNEVDEGLERAFRGQENFDFVPITDRWGTWVSAYVPLRDPAGRVEGALGVDFDAHEFIAAITNAKLRIISLVALLQLVLIGASTLNSVLRAQIVEREKTAESLQLLGSAVEQAKESVVITDAELDSPGPRIIFVNPAFTQMTGYTAAEAIGKTPRILQGPRSDKTVLSRLRQSLASGETFEGETINYRKDGKEFNIEWRISPIRNALGKTTHFVATQHDITERKRAEAALVETGMLLETLLQNSADYIYFKDLQSRFVRFSQGMLKLFRLTHVDELKGRTDFDFFSEEHARPAFEAEQEIIRTGKPILNLEEKETHNDGRVTWSSTSKMPWRDKTGNIIGTMGISRDIAERKRLEGHLFQSQKLETVGKLAGGIAHEFNSIMTAIIGQSELLLGDLPPGNPLAKSATEIRKAAERAAILTRQLLAYGRKQILQPEILDLNAVVVGMENMLLNLIGRGVQVQFNPAAGLKHVKADAGQIEQVIVNIVMNAADAMPNGGRLTLETANVTLDAGYVSHFPELNTGDYVMLAIGDTGAGMSEEVKARVFEPFFTTKDVGKGTGLGLATCHGIIKQSGGHIAVYSELGRGTTVKIYLPQAEQEMKPPAQLKTSPDLPRGTETILLVEDDPSLREMAATLLQRLGYTVLAAANGVEAMSLVHKEGTGHIDLLFTDVVMPQMSGKELADRIRALHPQTKILFTSAYTENTIVHQGVLNKGVALLQKPFTPSALARKVREMLDKSKS